MRSTSVLRGAVCAAAVFVFAGCAAAVPGQAQPAPDATFDLTGTLVLTDDSLRYESATGSCYGSAGYDDITAGASVTVYDNAGTIVGIGALDAGRPHGGSSSGVCQFDFVVADVPYFRGFYRVEVTHRGEITFTEQEALEGAGLTLGH